MQKPARSKTYATARRGGGHAADYRRELVLLEEFTRSHSVAALAGAIAARLGRATRSEDLIEEAGLEAGRRKP